MGFFGKIKKGLQKTKENISRKIFEVFKARALNEEFYDDLENALIASDMGVIATEEILSDLKREIFEKKITSPSAAKEVLKNILIESVDFEIPEYEYPLVLLVAGINGVGKTTTVGKLADYFRGLNKSVVIAAADTFRAAAAEQLEIWAERAGVRIIKHSENSDPAAVVYDALSSRKARNTDVVLIDTAGRLHNKKNLMEELKKINRVIKREASDCDCRNYIVLDATTGQNAVAQTEIFDEAIDIDGIILTKLDGTAKGGIVMAVSAEREIPVVYVGVGEKSDDLLPFDAAEFVAAILD